MWCGQSYALKHHPIFFCCACEYFSKSAALIDIEIHSCTYAVSLHCSRVKRTWTLEWILSPSTLAPNSCKRHHQLQTMLKLVRNASPQLNWFTLNLLRLPSLLWKSLLGQSFKFKQHTQPSRCLVVRIQNKSQSSGKPPISLNFKDCTLNCSVRMHWLLECTASFRIFQGCVRVFLHYSWGMNYANLQHLLCRFSSLAIYVVRWKYPLTV